MRTLDYVFGPRDPRHASRRSRLVTVPAILALVALGLTTTPGAAAAAPESWTDDALVAAYPSLVADGTLDEAIRNPTRPGEAPQAAFLEALAWYVSPHKGSAGTLTLEQLDAFVGGQVASYRDLLAAKVERGVQNDYPRTRRWKLIQKLILLRDEMTRPANAGSYPYPALPTATDADDPWERAHTVRSQDDFVTKVCEASHQRPVLVKYGNTNCTQCMLFELTGAVKAFAEEPGHAGVDVYKVWWGYKPDASFAGRIKDPARLDALVKAEGVTSSPTFVVYRNGRRYPCGSGFPDASGADEDLDTCLRQDFGSNAPESDVCSAGGSIAEGAL